MDLQQKFGERLLALLEEKNISQGEFAERMNCSRQSVNFYILGKRSPDISLAAKMAAYLGVSCDYLIGFSDYRSDRESNFSVSSVGLTEDTMKFFAGLKLMATGSVKADKKIFDDLGIDFEKEVQPYNMYHAQRTLDLLNGFISHSSFGILLQYIKRYRDLCHGEDEISVLKDFMLRLESPGTGKLYGGEEDNMKMMQEFCLYIASKYFDEIIRDISE